MDPKRPADSSVTFVRMMTQADANLAGNVHGGVILKEIDSVGGTAAGRHAGRAVVTAAIDEVAFLEPVYVGDILTVSATVDDVGRTSIEVSVKVVAEPIRGGEIRHTTTAHLVFVALDDDGAPVPAPPLVATTDDEVRRQEQARIRREIRRERVDRLRG